MIAFVAKVVVYLALLYGAWRLFRWSRGLKSASRTLWRRRFGLWLLFAPLLLFVAEVLTPERLEPLLFPLRLLAFLKSGVDWVARSLMDWSAEQVSWVYSVAISPLIYAIVYGGVGYLIGWPIDYLRGRSANDDGEEAAAHDEDAGADEAERDPKAEA